MSVFELLAAAEPISSLRLLFYVHCLITIIISEYFLGGVRETLHGLRMAL